MTIQEKAKWKNWADSLRQEMMTSLTSEVTMSVDAIVSETATAKAESTLQSVRFWRSCQAGKSPNDFFATAGFEVDFETTDERNVNEVTLRLNETWLNILNRVLERKRA